MPDSNKKDRFESVKIITMSFVRLKYALLVLALVFLILFLCEIEPGLIRDQLNRVGFGIIPILFISFLAYILSAAAWLICFENRIALSSIKRLFLFFRIRHIGESLASFNPTGVLGGDAFKYALLRSHDLDKKKAIMSLSLVRALTLISFIFLGVLCLFFVLSVSDTQFIGLWYCIGFVLVCAFLLFLVKLTFSSKLLVFKLISSILSVFGIRKSHPINQAVLNFNQSTALIRELRKSVLWASFALLMLHWLFGALEFMVILYYLGIYISGTEAFVLEIGTSFIRSMMGFIPGQIGVEEYSNKLFLQLIGISTAGIWISMSIIRRIRQIFWISVGIVLYFVNYRKLDFKSKLSEGNFATNGSLIHQS